MLGWILINTGHSVAKSFARDRPRSAGVLELCKQQINAGLQILVLNETARWSFVARVSMLEDLASDNQIAPICCSNSSEWTIRSSFLCLYDIAFGIANSCIGEIAATTRERNQLHPMVTDHVQREPTGSSSYLWPR
jgi:hypothetical protein